jgi:hypothetical protein
MLKIYDVFKFCVDVKLGLSTQRKNKIESVREHGTEESTCREEVVGG